MEYHFDHEIVLNPESEFKNLYPWSLSEVGGAKGRQSEKQIPWDWSLNFVSESVLVSRTVSTGHISKFKLNPEEKASPPVLEEIIHTQLKPFDGWDGINSVRYSMFGTSRKIEKINLRIHCLKSEKDKEEFTAWGCVSYSSEIDFRTRTEADIIEFHAFLRPSHFMGLMEGILSEDFNVFHVHVSSVSGFYSAWSPEVSTRSVKVLTRGHEHIVIKNQKSAIEIPRLGAVGEWGIRLERKIDSPAPETAEDEYKDETQSPSLGAISGRAALQRSHKFGFNFPLWLIAFLLLLILLK